jgi:carbonic anhydrase
VSATEPIARVPRAGVTVLTCMDTRIDPLAALGLAPGDAHVLRNAGGQATDDALRGLLLSQRLMGTTRVYLLHHTDCGLHGLDEDGFVEAIHAETGRRLPFRLGAFADVADDVRRAAAAVAQSPFLRQDEVRGFVLDVETGTVEEVTLP